MLFVHVMIRLTILLLFFLQAFQLLPEYLQVLDNYSELSAVQEMGRGVEVNINLIKSKFTILAFLGQIEKYFISLLKMQLVKILSSLIFHSDLFFHLLWLSFIILSPICCFKFDAYWLRFLMSEYWQAWLVRTIQKLDSHLLGVCQTFKEESYITVSISMCW